MADENHEKRRKKVRNEVSLERERDRSSSRSADEHRKKSKQKMRKRKSQKRSHSESESITDSSSSTSSSDSEQRTVKKRKKKLKKKSSSSDSSSSSSSGSYKKHSKSKHGKKKRKQKKEKRTKSRKKNKKLKHQGAVDQNKYGAHGILRESDMFVKQQEFYCWLQEVKNVNPEILPKFETRRMFESYMEDYNTATLPHKKYYDLEKWEAKRQQKNELKALKKAKETSFSIVDDEKQHDLLHRRLATNRHAGPSRQQLLEMQQELRRRQDEEYKKKAGIS